MAALLGVIAAVVLPHGSTATAAPVPVPVGDRVAFGAYVDGMVAQPERFTDLERTLGRPLEVASYFYGYGDEFPAAIESGFADGGRRQVLLSWDMGPYDFRSWSSGAHDAYLRRIGAHAAAYPHEVYVRPWPEMNGDWSDFQPTTGARKPYGGTPAEFVAAWRHVVSTVRAAGGDNVRWVFNPTADVYAETTDVRTIWPGRDYVDVLGIDGYNWGQDDRWGRWQSFEDVFAAQYERLTSLDPTLPVWICEVASADPAGDTAPLGATDKGRWIAELFASTAFPRLTTVVWFDEDKERDWRLTSSASALAAARSWLSPTRGVVCLGPDGQVVDDRSPCSRLSVDLAAALGRAPTPVPGLLVAASQATPAGGQVCNQDVAVVADGAEVRAAGAGCVSATVDPHGRVQVSLPAGASVDAGSVQAVDGT